MTHFAEMDTYTQLWYTITERRTICLDSSSLEINMPLKAVLSVMSSTLNILMQSEFSIKMYILTIASICRIKLSDQFQKYCRQGIWPGHPAFDLMFVF